jgi:hypothetical protein
MIRRAEPGGARNRANRLTSEIDPAELDQSHRIFFGMILPENRFPLFGIMPSAGF